MPVLPPSKYECPRCGFGIRPGDAQCDRCGESLKGKSSTPAKAQPNISVRQFRTGDDYTESKIRSVDTIPVSRPDTALQFKANDLDRREKALSEKERRLIALEENLEVQAKTVSEPKVERPAPVVDMDAIRQKIRDELVRQFEPELEALQLQLEEKEAELHEMQLKAQMLTAAETYEPKVDPKLLARITEEIFIELKAQLENPPKVVPVKQLRTNMNKLDEILDGGIPIGHLVLLCGPPGTMKSTLAFSILYRAAMKDGISGMYLSVEQSKRSITRQMEKMGMPMAATNGHLSVMDLRELRKHMAGEEGNLRELVLNYVHKTQKETGFKVFVLDSLESFKSMTEHCFTRQDMKDMFDWFRQLGITVFVISENLSTDWDEENQGEAYLSDGIMEMMMREMGDSRVQRWIRCVKMRGTRVDSRYYSMFHDGSEFNLSLPLSNQPF